MGHNDGNQEYNSPTLKKNVGKEARPLQTSPTLTWFFSMLPPLEIDNLKKGIDLDDYPPGIFMWNDTNLQSFLLAIPLVALPSPFAVSFPSVLTIQWLKGEILDLLRV